MLAQVSLTPTESKKLIAKAVVNLDVVKKAVDSGTVVIHPSSSTIFIAEEITGESPKTPVWLCGLVAPKGTCGSLEVAQLMAGRAGQREEADSATVDPGGFPLSWVVREKRLSMGTPLGTLLDEMGPEDVYIKGVNALDVEGNVGVLVGNRVEGGTMGRVTSAQRRKGFSLIFPVGLEKLIPGRISEVAREARKTRYDYSMGMNCGLLPCKGTTVTEPRAIEILSGAAATPIAAGGLGGAEGAVTMVIKGDTDQVTKAIEYIEECKGATLPPVRTPDCESCTWTICDFPLTGKPWVSRS